VDLMNYSNMTTAAFTIFCCINQPSPISSIDFHTHLAHIAHRSESEVVQPLPPPRRQHHNVYYHHCHIIMQQISTPHLFHRPPMPYEYAQARPIYPESLRPISLCLDGWLYHQQRIRVSSLRRPDKKPRK